MESDFIDLPDELEAEMMMLRLVAIELLSFIAFGSGNARQFSTEFGNALQNQAEYVNWAERLDEDKKTNRQELLRHYIDELMATVLAKANHGRPS